MSRTVTASWRLSANFLPILAMFLVSGGALFTGVLYAPIGVFAFVVTGWLISLCLHEAGHAFVAYRGGDRSVMDKGYLSLDPMAYADPMMSFGLPILFLLLGGIGLPGGSVYINTTVLKNRHWDSLVSAAGPAANLVVLCVLGLPFLLDLPSMGGAPNFWAALAFLAALQVSAILLNLLPIPGLDGFGIIRPYLPHDIQAQALRAAPLMSMVLLMLFMWRPFGAAIWNAVDMVTSSLGIDPMLVYVGYQLFRFWA